MKTSQAPNLIKEIHIARKGDDTEVTFIPGRGNDQEGGWVSVVCGRNNSGKSHFLRQVFYSIESHNANLLRPVEKQDSIGSRTPYSRGVSVTLDRPDEPCLSIYSFETYHQIVNKTRVPFGTDLEKKNYVERPILRACLKAACRVFEWFESNLPSPESRLLMAKDFFRQGKMYRVPVEETLLAHFERLTGANLFVRSETQKDHPATLFSLRYNGKLHMDYSNWSLGQQVLFCYLCLLEFERPALLLMDEPDHALHPSFMTELLKAAKQTCAQVIAATHHPHLIFSQYANDVWFLENFVKHSHADCPNSEDYRGHYSKGGMPKLRLSIQQVTTDIEKVAHAYQLFDSWDNRLLRLSDLAGIRLTQAMAAQMRSLLKSGVKDPSKRQNADIQTSNVNDLAELSVGDCILDYGAGRGRLLWEWQKIRDELDLRWVLWEPNTDLRSALKSEAQKVNVPISVPDSIDSVEDGSCDCIVIANVLHECTPKQIGAVLDNCARLIKTDGKLIVAELHPLLDAERFAVSYSSQEMIDLMYGSGWNGYPTALNIRSGSISAYFVVATLRERVNSEDITIVVENIWRHIQVRNCATFRGRLNFSEAQSLTGCLSELTEIAAIDSYFNGVWK